MTRRKSDARSDLVKRLRAAREGRQTPSTYGRVKAARERVKAAIGPPVTQAERVRWAGIRLREARVILARTPGDALWQAAVRAREAEHARERAVLDRLTQQRAS